MMHWTQFGTFYPFFRQHAHIDTKHRDLWLFGEAAVDRMHRAIQLRYILFPYLYTLFRVANVSGTPVMRPMWYEFPNEANAFDLEEQFRFGTAILVWPVVQTGTDYINMYLPPGSVRYEPEVGDVVKAPPSSDKATPLNVQVTMDGIPYFYRGAHIAPKKEHHRRSTLAMKDDSFTLVVALDGDGCARRGAVPGQRQQLRF
ncbi:unnamed protein product [Ostreobium quekettii]|uniref:Uncharacterized protein n=1 Tax=Ostreobium quekettii TaxID=121088 RepID=A0A8S1IMI6_9CHLO|nr:unnamed protein product [Ostreobium quekettii]